MENNGIKYSNPKVYLLNDSGLGVAEIAARTCYNSFENSENQCIKNLGHVLDYDFVEDEIDKIHNIESSELLKDLSWTYFHHSILEHINLQYLIRGTSRGVLQELVRHRIMSPSVRSTRYTMSNIINAYLACYKFDKDYDAFETIIKDFDMFVTEDEYYNKLQITDIWNKLIYQTQLIGLQKMLEISLSKENIKKYHDFDMTDTPFSSFNEFQDGKKKRNVGDAFKHIVNDTWKVDLVVTFNLRSLKNYFDLRDSGAAYFQIRELAQQMKKATPIKYLKLIDKTYKDK